jgi:Arc/MetJ family transcription regulator
MDMAEIYACASANEAYNDCMIRRTSLNLKLELVAEAREVLGTKGTTDTIHRALEDVVRRERLQALADERFEDLTPEALDQLRRWRTDGAS